MLVVYVTSQGTCSDAVLHYKLPPHQWMHLALVHGAPSGGASSGALHLFVDGELVVATNLRWPDTQPLHLGPFESPRPDPYPNGTLNSYKGPIA